MSPQDRRFSTPRFLRRPDHDDAGHAVGFQKIIQILLHYAISAARCVPHLETITVPDQDPAVKYIEMFSSGGKEDQISCFEAGSQPSNVGFRHTLEPCSDRRQAAHDIQYALFDNRTNTRRKTPDGSHSRVVPNPAGHVMVSAFPLDTPLFVSNLPKSVYEFTSA